MKAEERHRLHENELRRITEHARERARPFFDQYGTTLLLVLAGVLVALAAGVWIYRQSSAGEATGWGELDAAFRKPDATAEDFANVAEVAKGSPAATWARLFEGESHLDSGIQSLFTDKEGALRDLKDARAAFEAVLEAKDASPELTVRGLYGLARTLEATSDGDLKPALERYEQIAADHKDTVYAKLAQERTDALKTAESKSFYAWFSKQKPVLKDPIERPADATPPSTSLTPSGSAAGPAGGPALGDSAGASAGTPTAPESSGPPADPTPDEAPADSAASPDAATTEAAPAGSAASPPTGETAPAPQ